eukprot:7378545-Prymnesium_polylepis.2
MPSPAHSLSATARPALCSATSADAQAVSTLTHGPCSPSTKHSLPAATDTLSPVTVYTELRADGGCASAQSGRSMPKNTPVPPPTSEPRRCDDVCKAEYPCSSSSRCC